MEMFQDLYDAKVKGLKNEIKLKVLSPGLVLSDKEGNDYTVARVSEKSVEVMDNNDKLHHKTPDEFDKMNLILPSQQKRSKKARNKKWRKKMSPASLKIL